MRQRRARGAGGRLFDLPLPLQGYHARAAEADTTGTLASELLNWRSTGLTIRTREPVTWLSEPSAILQRIPYQSGTASGCIALTRRAALYGDASISGRFDGAAVAAAISGNVAFADRESGMIRFDGAEFHRDPFTFAGRAEGAPAIDGVLAHHDRLFVWSSRAEPDFWYGDVGAVQGEMTAFPLSRLGTVSGSIVAMLSLTVDAGHGMNDVLAIFTSAGQAILYEGLDPGDAQDWRLTARIHAASPISRLGFAQVGSDLWMLTASGLVPVSDALRGSAAAYASPLGTPIGADLAAALAGGATLSLFAAPDGSRIVVHAHDASPRQWCFETESRAWSRADWPARGFHGLAGEMRFTATDGREGRVDAAGEETIAATWQTPWVRTPGRDPGLASLEATLLVDGRATLRVMAEGDDGQSTGWQRVTLGRDGATGQRINHLFAFGLVAPRIRLRMEVTASRAELLRVRGVAT